MEFSMTLCPETTLATGAWPLRLLTSQAVTLPSVCTLMTFARCSVRLRASRTRRNVLEPNHTLVLGRTGSGKTIFVRRLALNAANVACRFVFDWNDRFTYDWTGRKLPLPTCCDTAGMNRALASRWVIYNPGREFPGCAYDRKIGLEALKHFCRYVRHTAKGGPGRKLVLIAELWMFCTEDSIPAELAMLAQDGRSDGVEFVFDTQRPEKLNPSVVGAATEVVCFRLDEKQALRAVAGMGLDSVAVARLPLGTFTAKSVIGSEAGTDKVF